MMFGLLQPPENWEELEKYSPIFEISDGLRLPKYFDLTEEELKKLEKYNEVFSAPIISLSEIEQILETEKWTLQVGKPYYRLLSKLLDKEQAGEIDYKVRHYILWLKDQDLIREVTQDILLKLVLERFPIDDFSPKKVVFWQNKPAHQSVPQMPHIHVVCKFEKD